MASLSCFSYTYTLTFMYIYVCICDIYMHTYICMYLYVYISCRLLWQLLCIAAWLESPPLASACLCWLPTKPMVCLSLTTNPLWAYRVVQVLSLLVINWFYFRLADLQEFLLTFSFKLYLNPFQRKYFDFASFPEPEQNLMRVNGSSFRAHLFISTL